MNPHKVHTIINWTTPTSIQDVQCFLGFAKTFQCVIAHYFTIVALLTCVTRKDKRFSCGVEAENAFHSLKVFFTTTPLFIHVDIAKHFV
jgi:hypothetical protein